MRKVNEITLDILKEKFELKKGVNLILKPKPGKVCSINSEMLFLKRKL